MAVLLSAAILGCGSAEDHAERVIMFVPEDGSADLELMLTMEVGLMKGLLEDAGFEVDVATGSGEPLTAEHTTLTPDLDYEEVDLADYDGLVLPCLAAPEDARTLPPELANMIREAVTDGKPVAAQTGAIITLADLGLLSGKRYAYMEGAAANIPQFEDAILSGDGIVEDGNIITSAVCPYAARERALLDGTTQLTEALIAQLRGEG
jgi:protease I